MKLCLYLPFSLIAYFTFANGKPVQDEENLENGWFLLKNNLILLKLWKLLYLNLTTKHVGWNIYHFGSESNSLYKKLNFKRNLTILLGKYSARIYRSKDGKRFTLDWVVLILFVMTVSG